MRKGVLLTLFAALVSLIVLSHPGGAAYDDSRDGTNAEGAQGGCGGGGCHSSATTNATRVELDSAGISVSSYHGGMAYTVKISASNGSTTTLPRYGFQLTAVKASGAGTSSAVNAGTWGTMPTSVRNTTPALSLLNINIIEQKNAISATSGTGGNGSTYVQSIPWTAPVAGTGSIVLYGIVNETYGQSPSKYMAATPVTITEATTVAPVASVTISQTSGSSTICQGSSVTFTAVPTNGGSAPTYQWKVNGTPVTGATSSTYTTTTLAAGSDAITCVMTSNLSGVTGNPATSNSVSVTVNASVTPAVSITSTGTSVCSGQSITFTASPTNGGSSPTYQWYKNGSTISGATASTYSSTTLANSDAITCHITSNASCASPTTATSNTLNVTITTNGTPSLTIVSSAGNAICSGQNVTFTATPVNGGTAPTYQWYNGNTAISGATSSTYSSSGIANGESVSCKMVSNSQCVSTSNATSNTITMTVTGVIVPAVSITSNAGNNICSGQNVTFTAAQTNGGSSPAYQWYNGNSVIGGATSSTYSSSSLANGSSITVVLTSSSSCASPSTATSNAIVLSIGTSSTASVTVSSTAGTSVCSGQTAILTANPVSGGSAPTYQWMLNGSNISGATSSTYTPPSISNGNAYSVQMVSNSSCVTQPTVTSSPLTFSVVAGGPASVAITSNVPLNICQGVAITFTATTINGGTNPAYQWTKNGVNVGTNSNAYMDNALANGDVVNCSISSSLSCAVPATAVSNNLTTNIFSLPTVAITNNNNVLTATSGNGYQYQWYVDNIAVTNGTSQTLVPNVTGNYTVAVTDVHGCAATSSPYNVTTVGIADPASLTGLLVYPNPADNNLFVDFTGTSANGKVIIRLFDMNGRVLLENTTAPVMGEKVSLDMSGVQEGIYLLQINEYDASAYRKVIVGR